MRPQSTNSRRCKVTLVAIVHGIVNCARHCVLTIVGRGYGLITKEEVMSQLRGRKRLYERKRLCHNWEEGRGYMKGRRLWSNHLWRIRVGIELLGQLKRTPQFLPTFYQIFGTFLTKKNFEPTKRIFGHMRINRHDPHLHGQGNMERSWKSNIHFQRK